MMRPICSFVTIVIMLALSAPAFAEGKKGKPGRHAGNDQSAWNCPPGLAKKNPPCVPPGQARKWVAPQSHQVGEHLRVGEYVLIRDPWAYGLDPGPGWDYYRDDRQIYRIDPTTRRILAVIELIEAFSN